MQPALLGKKIGMTQVYDGEGTLHAVTVVQVTVVFSQSPASAVPVMFDGQLSIVGSSSSVIVTVNEHGVEALVFAWMSVTTYVTVVTPTG